MKMKVNSPVKILLVDDLPENLFALELILSNKNYLCVNASSGNDALKILLHQPDFALILMDVQMPEMDGFETVELIREIETLKHVPIIFLTASMDNSMHIFKGYQAGAVDYMIKPLNPELLKAKVAVFVDLYLKTRELLVQNEEKENRAAELVIANKELAFQNEEKENRAAELNIANKELAYQNNEKEKRAAELSIANTELIFQNEEKENRAAELVIANKELVFQNEEKENRAAELVIANKELLFQNEEKKKRVKENIELEAISISVKQTSQYARSLIEASLDPLVTISPEGKITDVNEASVKVTGVPRLKLIGTDFSDYFTEPQKAREGYKQVFEKEFVSDYPLTIHHKNGNLTDVLYNASVYKDEKGNVMGIFAAARDVTAQKQASQYARSLIEASLDPLVTISPEGKITDVNEASVNVTGVPRLQLVGTDFSDYFTEPQKAREGYKQVFEKEFVSDYPLTIHHKNGKLTAVLYNASVYKDEKGNVLGIFAAARDVTAQKAEELSIANKELILQNEEKEKQAAVLEIANTELKFQNQEKENRAAELVIANKELAFQNEEKENRAAELVIANKELLFQNEEKENRAAELIIANNELAFQNEEKGNRAAELIIANNELAFQNEEKGNRAAELIIANNELAFQNEEKENRAAELIIANKELAFQNEEKENRAAELIIANKELAFQNEEKENRAADLIIANKELAFQNEEKENRAADLIILSEALKNQKAELRNANEELHEKALLLQQQEVKLIRINNDLLLLNQHLEKRVLDRTSDLEKINHELKDLSLSKDKFLSVISHDLRNPLTALLIASEQLSNDVEEHVFSEIQPYAKSIYRSSHNILKQLNELVDWANRQKEKTSFNPEKLKLFFAVDQSFELLKANARQKNIVLDNNVSVDIYVMADFLMLRSILQNLVTNAIKFSLEGGLIKVFALQIDKMVEVCVNDVGIGMETTVHENLFTQASSTIEAGTNNEKGSGLGLILVKDFVGQHDGILRVESEIKKGTSIFFTIPVGEP